MSDDRRIAPLGLHATGSQVVIYALGFVSSVLIARALGPEGRGVYVIPIAVLLIVVALASQGLELAQVRLWRRALPSDRVRAATWIGAAAGTAALALTWIVYWAGRSGPFEAVSPAQLLVVAWVVPFWVHAVLVRGLLILSGAVTTVNHALVAGDLVRTSGVVVLLLVDRITVEAVLAMFAVMIVVPWAITVRAVRRIGPLAGRPPRALVHEQVGLGAKLTPHFLFVALTVRVDVLLVAYLAGTRQAGVYSVAVLIAELVWLPTWALSMPVKERQANVAQGAAVEVTARAVRMTLLVAAVVAVALAVASPIGLTMVFGDGFAAAVPVVWALLAGTTAMAAWRMVTVVLVRLDPPRTLVVISLAALLVNLAANLVLIPALGIVGAGLASTAAYGCGTLLALGRLARVGKLRPGDLLPGRAELFDLVATLRPGSLRRQLAWLRTGPAR